MRLARPVRWVWAIKAKRWSMLLPAAVSRDSLHRAAAGEELMLASFCPFEVSGPYKEYGPVFIHAHEHTQVHPQDLPDLIAQEYLVQQFVLRAYSVQEGILYIGLPMMDVSLAEKLNKQISTLVAQNKKFSKVIIDIRGNPGGNDMTWRALIAHLYAKSFSLSITPKFKYNPQVLSRYATPKDGAKPEIEPLLNNAQYWTKKFDVRTTDRNPDSIDFKGKVYLLQDDYIYSSAGNFSNFALTNDEIISVGNTTDLVGGAQVEPLFYRLKNSQWIFRVEPMLDFSNVKKLNDFAHNEVEVKITPTIEDTYLRATYDGDIYGKDFLLHHDKLVKYVIDQR